ncbi:MAG TPA: hypothetical protein ENI99_12440 [Sedimenticola sp.]|nr:hypothetical protein [Sedimenticola sp.]
MTDLPPPRDPVDAIGKAYELLLEKALEEAHKLEEKSGPALHRMIDKVRTKTAELEELTKEEAEKLPDYLKRDLIDAARYIEETQEDFKTWFGFEVELVEERLRELFTQAADQTTVELLKLKEQASEYHTGEITGPGTLCCTDCGELLHFHRPGHIPPCPKCHGTIFERMPAQKDAKT